jgi:hypothetical protein
VATIPKNSCHFFCQLPKIYHFMKFWNDDKIKTALPLCDRNIDNLHESILKKHREKLDWEQKEKLKNLISLRPPTKRQKKHILSLVIGGECDKSINFKMLESYQNNPTIFKSSSEKINDVHILDTLALLRTLSERPEKKEITKETKAILRKRAAAKYHTNQYLKYLIQLNSPLKNSYCNTLTCCESVISINGSLISAYCKNRWCQVCNRIKTANLINGYQPELEKIEDKKFVTLTFANCDEVDLIDNLKHYQKWWRMFYLKKMDETRKIRRLIANCKKRNIDVYDLENEYRRIRLTGIKKIECTYNAITNQYHPHIHLLVNGEKYATEILLSWFTYCTANNLKVNDAAQKIENVDSNVCKELFKYFSKINSSTGKNVNGKKEKKIFIHALDAMFSAMKGYQVFTAFGIDKIVDEDEVKPIYENEETDEVYMWSKTDWITENKVKLSNYLPSTYEKNRRKYIVHDKKYTFKKRMPKRYVEKIENITYFVTENMNV